MSVPSTSQPLAPSISSSRRHCACVARRRREVQLFCSDEGCGAEASPLQPEHQGRPPADPEVQRRIGPGIPYIQQTLEKAV